mmetsp:Transcript_36315/g.58710  ORF Transcript_36315/g.58710 Transcript_36315/m.58710 type:complete len:201 (+) Transcript_36315:1322-1924(+)
MRGASFGFGGKEEKEGAVVPNPDAADVESVGFVVEGKVGVANVSGVLDETDVNEELKTEPPGWPVFGSEESDGKEEEMSTVLGMVADVVVEDEGGGTTVVVGAGISTGFGKENAGGLKAGVEDVAEPNDNEVPKTEPAEVIWGTALGEDVVSLGFGKEKDVVPNAKDRCCLFAVDVSGGEPNTDCVGGGCCDGCGCCCCC